jgi:glutamate racemase
VERIEQGLLDHPQTFGLLKTYCQPLIAAGADTIVLGCTHYPFVRHHIQQIVGPGVTLIDTGSAVAKRLQQVLSENGLLNTADDQNQLQFLTSGAEDTQGIMRQLWQTL